MSEKKRTITLTDRPPVRIDEDEWGVVASASDKEFDNQYEFQANRISKWYIGVREHDDGRCIVYATYSYTTNYQNSRGYSAKRGVMLPKDSTMDDVVKAIKEVASDISGAEHDGEDSSRWPTLANDCIADLPAEEIK